MMRKKHASMETNMTTEIQKNSDWVECIDANLITTVDIRIVSVYHRPSVGDCRCKKFYQGSHEFILNLTNEQVPFLFV